MEAHPIRLRHRLSLAGVDLHRRAAVLRRVPDGDNETLQHLGTRALAVFGDSVTTDHISPAGSIKETSPAGVYHKAQGVAKTDFQSYGTRRGHHEVMIRGTFANVRIRNLMVCPTDWG